ncbi:MAG: CinA family nicotinamide mononucleotide deamidase-related protein [Fusobacteriaceae bacterium]
MKAILIIVGTEFLNGGMIDTNSLYIAEELNKYGIEIESKITVRDFIPEIIKILKYAKENSDLIIVTGGLGPTIDDITKEAIGEFLNKKLIVEEEDVIELKLKFKKLNIDFIYENYKEIEKPQGSISFKNDVGMAPSIYVDGVAAFPGVPRELHNLFPKFIKWYRDEFIQEIDAIYIKDIITVGIPESILEEKIKSIFTVKEIYYEFLIKDYGILVRFQCKMSKKNIVEKIIKNLYNIIGNNILGEDDDRGEILLINMLREKGYKLSVAESCTGGLLSSKIVDVSGASTIFHEGLVTYSNSSKNKRLNISEEILNKYGAVSSEVALEMLKGLGTNVGISVTGIAGPHGGTVEKPIGTVYIGIKINEDYYVEKYSFKGTRKRIREKVVLQALFNSIKFLKN